MGLFGKKNETPVEETTPADERIISQFVNDSDYEAAELVDKMKNGHPLLLNFKKLDLTACNKLLAFFVGATYALEGKTIKINERTYLFALQSEFEDGTLNNYIEDVAQKD